MGNLCARTLTVWIRQGGGGSLDSGVAKMAQGSALRAILPAGCFTGTRSVQGLEFSIAVGGFSALWFAKHPTTGNGKV